jgi:hypothetical protein
LFELQTGITDRTRINTIQEIAQVAINARKKNAISKIRYGIGVFDCYRITSSRGALARGVVPASVTSSVCPRDIANSESESKIMI